MQGNGFFQIHIQLNGQGFVCSDFESASRIQIDFSRRQFDFQFTTIAVWEFNI